MSRPAASRSGRRPSRGALVPLTLLPAALLLAVACSGSGRDAPEAPAAPRANAESPTPAPAPAPSPAPTPNPAQPAEIAAVESWDAAGIAVERLLDGSIRLRGVDRWGVRVDTVYADATYFANAVPVFSRGLTDEQARAVTALVPRVRTAAGTPPAPAP